MNSDENLIAGCINQNPVAQEALYRKYASRMRFICQRYARTSFEVEDIFQESFIKVLTNIEKFKGAGSLDGWIRRIFINTAIDYCKKNLKWNEHRELCSSDIEDKEVEEPEDFFTIVAGTLHKEDLLEIINKLPEGYKLVFNLYAVESYSHAQIAEVLNISEGTSKSQLFKARKMLKVLISEVMAMNEKKMGLKVQDGGLRLDVSA